MTMLILALVVAALGASAFLWKKPDARAVTKAAAGGAWESGRTQAVSEFRDGYKSTRAAYDQAQKALRKRGTRRARTASFVLEVLGVTVVTAGGAVYGAAKTVGATRRIVVEATRGGRAAVKAATVVEAEVVKDSDEETNKDVVHEPEDKPGGDAPVVPEGATLTLITDTVIIATATCGNCGAEHTVTIGAGQDAAMVPCECGRELHLFRARPEETPEDEWVPTEEERARYAELRGKGLSAIDAKRAVRAARDAKSTTQSGPTEGPSSPEGTTMAAEASGLITYSQAHAQLAGLLQGLSVENNNLANSMTDVVAAHASIIANTAVLQDLMNQAASIAQQIANDAAALATS